jgi:hypothetical protein
MVADTQQLEAQHMSTKRSRAELAHQLFPHIVEFARRKEVTGYVPLAQRIGHPHFVMQSALGPIMFLCEQRHPRWPALTSIVVNRLGVPGGGFDDRGKSIPELQREVFDFDWDSVGAPTVQELQEADDRGLNPTKAVAADQQDDDDETADDAADPHVAQNRRMIVDALNKTKRIVKLVDGNPYKAERHERYQVVLDFAGKTVWQFVAQNGPVGTLIRAVRNRRMAIE